jgi:hypothetical protein
MVVDMLESAVLSCTHDLIGPLIWTSMTIKRLHGCYPSVDSFQCCFSV